MKTTCKILKSVMFYLFLFVITNMVFCLIFYHNQADFHNSYVRILLLSMTGRLGAELLNENWMLLLLGIQKFLELIYVSVLTGYIFAYILNREPKIVLPQKLVIRHRTSENVEKLLTLGILVGNKSRFNLHNVCCTVTCYYLKNKKNPKLTNGEFQIRQEVHKLENYYRFSFDLKEFPSKILKDFIEKDPVCLEIDSINVSISGNANLLGNTFMVDRKYKLSDIVIDEHIPVLKNDIRTPFIGKKLYQIIKWKELDRTEEVSETKRNKIINEINTIIVGKIKKKQDITVRRTSSLKNSRIINIPIFHIGWITVPRTSVCRRKPTAGS